MSPREPRVTPVRLDDLRPTQMTVGYREVEQKRESWRQKSDQSAQTFLGDHMIPVLKGPKDKLFVIDHHHLARALIDRQLESPSTELTDSCAIADHPMIDRIWPDRQQMADLLIGVDPGGRAAFPLIAGRARLQRNVRAALNAVANTALRRRAS